MTRSGTDDAPTVFTVRDSPVHGTGVFAARNLRRGAFVGWYDGEVIDDAEADRRHAAGAQNGHTMFFARSDGLVIDGDVEANALRFLNHSCEPNCEAQEHEDGAISFVTTRKVPAGRELFIAYELQLDPADLADSAELYACRCGAPACRGTMIDLSQLSSG